MIKRTKPIKLDAFKQKELLAILSVGCSRRAAARYVGCSLSTIQAHAKRDEVFADKLRRAESKSEFLHMKNISAAGQEQRYWRASAWALERLNPNDFAPRPPAHLTPQQASETIEAFSLAVVEEVPNPRTRKQILRRLRKIYEMLRFEETAEKRYAEWSKIKRVAPIGDPRRLQSDSPAMGDRRQLKKQSPPAAQ